MTREHGVNSKFSNYLLNPINDFPELFTDTLVNSFLQTKILQNGSKHTINHY